MNRKYYINNTRTFKISVAQTQEHIHLKHRIMDIISVFPKPRTHTFKTQNHGYYISVAQSQEHIHLIHRIMDIISVLPTPKNTYI